MGMQLALPLEADSRNEAGLRHAWARSGLTLPFEVAVRDRAIEICLRCFAESLRNSGRRPARTPHQRKRHG